MNPKRKQRLILVLAGVAGVSVTVFLVLFAMRQSVNFFFTPTEISAGVAPQEQVIRLGGMVREGSVERASDSLKVSFHVTDYAYDVAVEFEGILPDLFREGDGVVAIGKLNGENLFVASEVLAKHDETYMPPEVTHALEQAGQLPDSY